MRLIRINELQPRNYNSLSSYKYRCTSCVPTNYNIEECCEEDASYGALHAHQRITTARPGEIQRKPRVRSVRTNELQRKKLEKYLTNSKVRSVRTHELQPRDTPHLCGGYRCASCAPTNYNNCVNVKNIIWVGAPHAHQRITTTLPD